MMIANFRKGCCSLAQHSYPRSWDEFLPHNLDKVAQDFDIFRKLARFKMAASVVQVFAGLRQDLED